MVSERLTDRDPFRFHQPDGEELAKQRLGQFFDPVLKRRVDLPTRCPGVGDEPVDVPAQLLARTLARKRGYPANVALVVIELNVPLRGLGLLALAVGIRRFENSHSQLLSGSDPRSVGCQLIPREICGFARQRWPLAEARSLSERRASHRSRGGAPAASHASMVAVSHRTARPRRNELGKRPELASRNTWARLIPNASATSSADNASRRGSLRSLGLGKTAVIRLVV
jgi:hypothetical protein